MIAYAILVLLFTLAIAACPLGRHRAAVESAVIFGVMVAVASVSVSAVEPWLFFAMQWALACLWVARLVKRGAALPAQCVVAVAGLHLLMAVDRLLYPSDATAIYQAHSYIAVTIYLIVITAIIWDGRHGDNRVPRRRWDDFGHSKTNRVGR